MPATFVEIAVEFRFPSNGKAYPKDNYAEGVHVWYRVSIPFKRESLSKVTDAIMRMFDDDEVSIPFKRESLSKV